MMAGMVVSVCRCSMVASDSYGFGVRCVQVCGSSREAGCLIFVWCFVVTRMMSRYLIINNDNSNDND